MQDIKFRGLASSGALLPQKDYSFLAGGRVLLLGGPLNLLLLCTPLALLSNFIGWPEPVTFTLSLLSIAPFAERLGFVTEQLALHTNDTIGGLLNATFGNATELIVAISALRSGLYRVIQLSLLGSILSNMLLVLGTAFLFGGFRHKTQTFGAISGQVNSSLLMLSCMGLLFPSILTNAQEESAYDELTFSRITSLILLGLYGCYLFFQLSTHRDAYEPEAAGPAADAAGPSASVQTSTSARAAPADVPLASSGDCMHERLIDVEAKEGGARPWETEAEGGGEGEEEEEEDEDVLGFSYALFWLAVLTVFIALLSDAMVGSIEATSKHVSGFFLSAVVLPIVGNAAEHAGAVMFAMKVRGPSTLVPPRSCHINPHSPYLATFPISHALLPSPHPQNKLDLSLGVAIGSSTQIALMVLPLLVVLGWLLGKPMSLNFHQFETATLMTTVIIVTFAIKARFRGQWNIPSHLSPLLSFALRSTHSYPPPPPTLPPSTPSTATSRTAAATGSLALSLWVRM